LAGNMNYSENRTLIINLTADLEINYADILFSNPYPVENENITINATIRNPGFENATSINVGFYDGNYISGSQIGIIQTIDLLGLGQNITLSANWTAKQGSHDIYVVVDLPIESGGSVIENNETNNIAYKTVSISSSQVIVGNLSGSLVLGDNSGFTLANWKVNNISGSKVYVADSESGISFVSLVSLGRTIDNDTRIQDFAELDTALGTTNYSDSINTSYTYNGAVKEEYNITIFGKTIPYVPIVNSTNSSLFFTGIFWDSSDDTRNGGIVGEYDLTAKEDIVFVTQATKAGQGKYGKYDYEIRVPANLRKYMPADSNSVSLYGEIT
jgi:hypothetical protein